MIEPVSKERWQEAQLAEATAITYDRDNCQHAYELIFQYLGLSFDLEGKSIVEVGCGGYPAVSFCENVHGTIIEPLWFDSLQSLGIPWMRAAVEDIETLPRGDECWIYNALQHVRDPELFIAKCKEMASVIRFFEPVDYPVCLYHPHTFSQSDFERWFGDVKRYTDRLPQFFDSDCVYGTWRADA